jgi:prepilin-type N-terminal cleavage/methylation domain-containing protein
MPINPKIAIVMTTDQSISLTPRFSEVPPVAARLRTVSTVSLPSGATKSRHAFTFVELLVVLAVLALMVCLLATARAGSRPNSQGSVCLNNLKQLMAALTMYTHDYNEFFPPNPDTVTHVKGGNWVPDDESGWMPIGSIGSSPDAGNPDLLRDRGWNPLASYIRTNISLYRCPFDPRIVRYGGSDSNQFGQKIPAIRGVSMNGGVGTKGPAAGGGNDSVDGPWLDGNHTHTANNPYATFGKWSDFKAARPSDIWVLGDDDPWTINDGALSVIAAMPESVDYPNVFNDNSTALAFADGHGETHKWKSNLFFHNSAPGRITAQPGLQYQDWFWWASHATRSTVTGTVP